MASLARADLRGRRARRRDARDGADLARRESNAHPGSTQPAKAYRLLRAIFNIAVDDEKVPLNPCRIKGAGQENAAGATSRHPEEVLAIAETIEPQYRALVSWRRLCPEVRGTGRTPALTRRPAPSGDPRRRATGRAQRRQDCIQGRRSRTATVRSRSHQGRPDPRGPSGAVRGH